MVPGDDREGAASRHSAFIDNCAWDVFFDAGIDLSRELPSDAFDLWITREAEFEIKSLALSRPDLKTYVDATILHCTIRSHSYFGFHEGQHADDEQRVGGWDKGMWASAAEFAFMEAQKAKLGTTKKPRTKLYKNEADVSLAARSLHSIVLTRDKKKGPLRDALNQGGKVVLLNDFPRSGQSLRTFIETRI